MKQVAAIKHYFRTFRLIPLLFLGASAPTISACSEATGPDGCCKVCTTGKACGDSCINASQTCSKGAGCACNG